MKTKHRNKKKPFIEQFSGSALFQKVNMFVQTIRIIDHDNDLYKEIITDPKTGEIIHECEEPLSKHIGYGEGKHKKKIN
jgi:hypothetical protein